MEIYCEKFSQKSSILDVWLGSKFTFAGVLTNLFLMKVVGKKEGKKYWTESNITYTAIQNFNFMSQTQTLKERGIQIHPELLGRQLS